MTNSATGSVRNGNRAWVAEAVGSSVNDDGPAVAVASTVGDFGGVASIPH